MKCPIYQLVVLVVMFCGLPILVSAQNITQNTGRVERVDTAFDSYGGFICIGNIESYQEASGGTTVTKYRCNARLIAASSYAAAYAQTIAERLAETNTRLAAMAEASAKTQAAVEKMTTQMSEAIQQIVIKRFETLPAELLNDPVVKERLKKLQEDIIKDIKDSLSKPVSGSNPE